MPKGPLDHLFPDTEDDIPFANDAERSAYFDKILGKLAPEPQGVSPKPEEGTPPAPGTVAPRS